MRAMSHKEAFQKRYDALNEQQKQAVDTIEGPVMVIAGPGTGKTTILTLRIANILLQTDTQPENILALTFTESGVYAMRKKLVEMLGNVGYRIRIHTFHGFANETIQTYPEYFPRIIGGTSITETEHIQAIESILDTEQFQHIKPYGDTYYYVNAIRNMIRDLKREGVTADEFASFLAKEKTLFESNEENFNKKTGKLKSALSSKQNKLERSIELVRVYELYQKHLEQKHQYDFEDMILELVQALQNEEGLLLTLQEEHQYILADEHQDTNNAQNTILELLASFHESPNLFIVGDEKQAIYRFQGASLENFLYFKGRYKDATLITLDTNYRSTQAILDSSHEVIVNNIVDDPELRIQLKAGARDAGKPLHIYEFTTEMLEHQFIVRAIEEKIKAGTDPSDIAVLYRNNADVDGIARYLEQTTIPFTIYADRNLLDERDAIRLVTLLQVAADPLDNVAVARLVHMAFLGLPAVDAHRVIRYARNEKMDIVDVVSDSDHLQRADVQNKEAFVTFGEKIKSWAERAHDVHPLMLLEIVFKESGLLEDIFKHEASYERLHIVDSFFRQIDTLTQGGSVHTITDVLAHIATLAAYKVRVPVKDGRGGGVSLMTAHRSKGLEFEHVFVIGATDKKWGGKNSRTYFITPFEELGDTTRDADERRLFYVALTRAKETVTITYAQESESGQALLPSIFLSELKEELVTHEDTAALEKELGGITKRFEKRVSPSHNSAHDIAYLQEKFLEQPFSVTALNNYLSCPWEYFFVNLVRIPKVYTKFQRYGTAIHEALDHFFTKYQAGEDPDKDVLLQTFIAALPQSVLSEAEYMELLEKGKTALSGYFDTYKGTWPQQLLNEFNVKGVELETPVGTLVVTGKLDKVEFITDHTVNVVDYKTSKPKSRNALLGKTQSEDGAYFRQLVFYKVLLNRFDDGKYQMQTGTIDFVEPDPKSGVFKKEIFEITDDHVRELEQQIQDVATEIHSMSFWDTRCDDKDCEFCALRDLME